MDDVAQIHSKYVVMSVFYGRCLPPTLIWRRSESYTTSSSLWLLLRVMERHLPLPEMSSYVYISRLLSNEFCTVRCAGVYVWGNWAKPGLIGLPNRPTEFGPLQVSSVPSDVYAAVFLATFSRSYFSAFPYRPTVSLVLI